MVYFIPTQLIGAYRIRAPENHIYLFSISVVFGAESKIKILMSIIYLTMVVYVNSLSQIMYLVE